MRPARHYIAETDAEGEIVCVWLAHPSLRAPRPVIPGRDDVAIEDPAEFSGASDVEIIAWLVESREPR